MSATGGGMMIEPKAMQEIHEIREAIYEAQKNMSRDEILQSLHTSYKQLVREKGLKVRLRHTT